MQVRVVAFVLAGGKGTRLYPLTKERAKPAVPFGGRYRIVDFVLSNLINSGIYSVYVLLQFKSQSLLQHLRDGWEANSLLKEHFIIPVPAQMRTREGAWYSGTADAIYQNMNLIEQANPHYVAIFGADHIYRMDIRAMLEYQIDKRAQATVAAIPVHRDMRKDCPISSAWKCGAALPSIRRCVFCTKIRGSVCANCANASRIFVSKCFCVARTQ
jgi:glucose-1-phosphate adenylyltransferase